MRGECVRMIDEFYKKYACTYLVPHHELDVQNTEKYLVINSCGYYDGKVPINPTLRPEGRSDYYFAYNYSGESYINSSGTVRKAKSGDILFYQPGEPQNYWYDKDGYVKNYWIHFTGYGAAELFSELKIASSVPVSIGFVMEIGELIEKSIDEINSMRPGSDLSAIGMLLQLFGILKHRLSRKSPLNLSLRNENVYQTLEYIRIHFNQDLRVEDLAAMAFLSVNRYINVFKELIGITPQKYIVKLRLQKSIELMQMTDYNISQISEMVGYPDQLYFSRVCKQILGRSPSVFLKQIRGR